MVDAILMDILTLMERHFRIKSVGWLQRVVGKEVAWFSSCDC